MTHEAARRDILNLDCEAVRTRSQLGQASSITKGGKGPIDKYLGRKLRDAEAAISSSENCEDSDTARAKKRKIQRSPKDDPKGDEQRKKTSRMENEENTIPKTIIGTEEESAASAAPNLSGDSRYSIMVGGLRDMDEVRTELEGSTFMQKHKPHGVQFHGPRFTIRGEAVIWAKDPYSFNKILKGEGWTDKASKLTFSPSTRIKTEGPAVVFMGVPIKRWATPEEVAAPLARGTTTYKAIKDAVRSHATLG